MTDTFEKVAKTFLDERRLKRIEQVASLRTASLTVVLDRIHNTHNVSAVLRSADAFGLRDVHIVGDLEISQGIALGTDEWLRIHQHRSAKEALSVLQEEGFLLAVTAPEDQQSRATREDVISLPVFSLPFEKRLALVFGNEKEGVCPELFHAAKYHAYIPMFGFVESFNISVACAICLFCSTIQVAETKRRVPVVDETQSEELLGEWLRRNLRHADRIERELQRRK